jgi:hypothetical protein
MEFSELRLQRKAGEMVIENSKCSAPKKQKKKDKLIKVYP